MKISDYLTLKEAANILGVAPQTLRNWDRDQKLKSYRNPFNKYRLYKEEDIRAILSGIVSRSWE
jgi:excisionase family DNA binding protein